MSTETAAAATIAETPTGNNRSFDETKTAVSPLWSTVLWSALAAIIAASATALVTRHTKISEFRQAWINELRKDIADYLGAANAWRVLNGHIAHSFDTKGEGPDVQRKTDDARTAARVILWRIRLRFNPRPNPYKVDDDLFLGQLAGLLSETRWKSGDAEDWDKVAEEASERAREILKREWEVTKKLPLPTPHPAKGG